METPKIIETKEPAERIHFPYVDLPNVEVARLAATANCNAQSIGDRVEGYLTLDCTHARLLAFVTRHYRQLPTITDAERYTMLDPDARALLDLLVEKNIPPVHTVDPITAREAYVSRRFATQHEPSHVAAVTNTTCPGKGGSIGLRMYRPASAPERHAPALVFYHGGGWVIGDLDTHDGLCRHLANRSGGVVVAVDYRLAPEDPFPAAVDDAIDAFTWVAAQASTLGLDPHRIAVGGDSAGGNLAAVVALNQREERARDPGAPQPCFQLLIYPATDKRMQSPSHEANGQGYLLTHDTMRYFRGHYLPNASHYSDWRASPLLASSHANLPPALVLTAGFDPLRDEGRQYADALSADGTRCTYVCFERQIHGFMPMDKAIQEATTATVLCGEALKAAYTSAQ